MSERWRRHGAGPGFSDRRAERAVRAQLACSGVREDLGTIVSVQELIIDLWPGRFTAADLQADVALGEQGLGLDSLEVVQLIFACEDYWGKAVGEGLFATSPLTIERLAHEFSGI